MSHSSTDPLTKPLGEPKGLAVSGQGYRQRYWRRHAQPIVWWPWGLLPLLGLLLAYLWGAFITAPAIEADVTKTVTARLQDQGFAAVEVAGDGQAVDVDVALGGVPGTQAFAEEAAHAKAVARATRCGTWLGRLICPTQVSLTAAALEPAPVPPVPQPELAQPVTPVPHDFVLTRDGNGTSFNGEAPDEAAREDLVRRLEARFQPLDHDIRITQERATSEWPLAVDRALSVVNRFERGSASWEAGRFSASGLVQAEQEASTRALFHDSNAAPTLGSLTLDIAKSVQNCNAEFANTLSEGTINFTTGSATIDDGSQALLVSLAQTARQCPGRLLIEGHTDDVGAATFNLTLSQSRADAVRTALIELGVAGNRLSAVGYGESQPRASNENEAGRAQNRRIVVQIASQTNPLGGTQ